MTQHEYLSQMELQLRTVLEDVRGNLAKAPLSLLQKRPQEPKRWNILECFEHLNRHMSDYLPFIELAIHKAKARQMTARPEAEVAFNFIGKEALRWMRSAPGKRYKTAKRYNPYQQPVSDLAIKSFIINVEKMLRLIQMAKEVDVNRTKVRFAILPLFSFRLGNLLEVLTLHAIRHVAQANRLWAEVQ